MAEDFPAKMNDHAPKPAPIHLVDSDEAVEAAAEAISALDEVALDTEFHSERRYHAELMLLQVSGVDGKTWLADPRSCDVGPIIRAVSARSVVLHAGQEDLAILQREADVAPHDLLDVQIGAGMLGLGYPTRLGTLVKELLGQTMDKRSTLSDWSQRPLSQTQLRYAASDVQILPRLTQKIRTELQAQGRLEWAKAASVEMAARHTRPRTCDHTWIDWDIAHQLEEVEQATMQAIFEWRDARGRDKDQPPHFMLSDGLALDLARRRPDSIEQLQANRRIPGGLVRRFGKDLVQVVAQAQFLDLGPLHIPTPSERTMADALELWALMESESTGIAPRLAMPRRLALALAKSGAAALTGWRDEAIGASIRAFLEGETGIFLGPDTAGVR